MDERMYKDAILNSDFQVSCHTEKNILITGASGFLGAHLLYELLEQTKGNIYVLVRGESLEFCYSKIEKKLQGLLLWKESYADRIFVIQGDAEKKQLALSNTMWQLLCNTIDIIIHDAAYVNLMGTYEKHYGPNVVATQEVLNLAATGKAKKLAYVSTSGFLGALYDPKEFEEEFVIAEDAQVDEVKTIFSYLKTKWAAEKLVQQAAKKGIDTAIFRLPYVGCDTMTGYFNRGDILWSRLKAIAHIGKFPAIDYLYYVTPVDYAAKTIVYIAMQDIRKLNFYTVLGNERITWHAIAKAIDKAGYPVETVDIEEWYPFVDKYLEETKDRDVQAMLVYARDYFSVLRCPVMSNKNFMAALPKEMHTCQSINEIVASYFKYGDAHNM